MRIEASSCKNHLDLVPPFFLRKGGQKKNTECNPTNSQTHFCCHSWGNVQQNHNTKRAPNPTQKLPSLSGIWTGTPNNGTPESGKRDPYYSHIFRDSKMGIVWVPLTIFGVPCPWGSRSKSHGDSLPSFSLWATDGPTALQHESLLSKNPGACLCHGLREARMKPMEICRMIFDGF